MATLPLETLGDAYTSRYAWEVLEDIVDAGNRMPGHEGERRAATVVERGFADAGLDDVHVEEFDIPGWWRESATVGIASTDGPSFDRAYEVLALPGTPAGSVEAELVDLGHGLPEDVDDEVEGKIAMVRSDNPDDYGRWVHRMEKYGAVVDAGAIGFIFGNHIEGCLPPTGEVGYQNRPAPIPAVGVSSEVAAELRRLTNASPSVELSVDCRNDPASSRNVHAELGPDTEQRVLVSAHVDAHDISQGAMDNGVGSALVVELGRLLAGVDDRLETRVEFVTFGSEEIGLYGSRHYTRTHDCSTVKAVLNLDAVGMSRTPHVRVYDPAMLPPLAAATDGLGVPLSSLERIDAATDAWPFVVRGVPAVTAGSEKTESGRGWGHTHGDTLDKVDPRNLRDLAAVFASMVVELADADLTLDHRSPETVREQLDEGCINELHAGGRWPYETNSER